MQTNLPIPIRVFDIRYHITNLSCITVNAQTRVVCYTAVFSVAKIPAMICMNLSTQASISDISLRVHWKNNLEVSEHLL